MRLSLLLRPLAAAFDRLERLDGTDFARSRPALVMRYLVAALFLAVAVIGTTRSLGHSALPGPEVVLMLMFATVLMMNRIGRFLRDWSPVLVILLLYVFAFGFVDRFQMHVYYRPQFDADIVLGLGQLPSVRLQELVGRPPLALEGFAVLAYASHFFFPLLIGFYLWWQRSDGFRRLLYADIIVSAMASLTTMLAPTAPPWLAAQHGMAPVHEVLRTALGDVGLGQLAALKGDAQAYNVVAAFPSIHAAFPVLGLIALIVYRAPRWIQIAQLLQLLAVWFVIVWTGEHYLIDVLGGILYAFAAWWAAGWALARLSAARAAAREQRDLELRPAPTAVVPTTGR